MNKNIQKHNLTFFFNSWLSIGGGGVHTIQLVNASPIETNIKIIMPELAFNLSKDLLQYSERLNYSVYSTPFEKKRMDSFILPYLLRLIISSRISRDKRSNILTISNSQLPFDLIPSILNKIINGGKLVVFFHHGNPCVKIKGIRGIVSKNWFFLSVAFSKIIADRIIVINPRIGDYLTKFGVDKHKLMLSNNGIDLSKIEKIPKGPPEYDGIFLGRVDSIKGVYDLLDAWSLVLKKRPFSKLMIIGDGPDLDNLRTTVRHRNQEKNIYFSGMVSEEEKIRLLKTGHWFIYPSHQESWGIVIAEAMACGLPVIAYDLPVYHDIFPRQLVLTEAGSIEKLSEIILKCINDYNKMTELANNGLGFIKKYDWMPIVDNEWRFILGE